MAKVVQEKFGETISAAVEAFWSRAAGHRQRGTSAMGGDDVFRRSAGV